MPLRSWHRSMTARGSPHPAGRAGVLHQHAAQVTLGEPVGEVGDHDLDAHRLRAGAHHRQRLRQRVRVDDEGPGRLAVARRARVIASAAAVPSSSREALAVGSPVRSATMVWKFSSASSRPWEISGWYGV